MAKKPLLGNVKLLHEYDLNTGECIHCRQHESNHKRDIDSQTCHARSRYVQDDTVDYIDTTAYKLD